MYLRRVGIKGRDYAAAPMQISTAVTHQKKTAKACGGPAQQMLIGAELI
jgi:hypothetical protein